MYHEQTGKDALWTNSMFGGMPAFQIRSGKSFDIYHQLLQIFRLYLPYYTVGILFTYLLGFYFLLRVLKMKPLLAFLGSVAFAFTSYNIIIILAGHITKAYAIGYMAPVVAGIILTYRGNFVTGGLITMVAIGLEIATNHFQITYYLLLMMALYVLIQLFEAIREKTFKKFLVASAVVAGAMIFGLLPNATSLWTTYQYGKYSTRGPSELTENSGDQTSGLDKSYILNDYSYGIGETMTLLIPDFMGGPSAGSLPKNSKVAGLLRQSGYPEAQIESLSQRMPTYFGHQRFTAGPVYVGAITIFLFIFALFFLEGPVKWWLISATVFSILLAWGKNFFVLSDLFIDYLPGYNKFRTVSMILVIASFAIPLGALLGLRKILTEKMENARLLTALKYSYFIVGGLTLFFAVIGYNMLDFSSPADKNLPQALVPALMNDRATLLRMDAFRAFVFISLAAGLIFLYFKKLLKSDYLLPGMIILVLADLWTVDKRYVNNDYFVTRRVEESQTMPTQADKLIMQDTTYYRVLNLTVDPFNDATTSYFHKSIGGYHGAKLKRYQQLIERYIGNQNMNVLDMLNTKYIITVSDDKKSRRVIKNPDAMGNAWFVDSLRWVPTPDDEIATLGKINPATTAVINDKFHAVLGNATISSPDSADSIKLTKYAPDQLTYHSSASGTRFVVFSEIYYPKGWKATIDGKEAPITQVDFVLRGMIIPAGEHTIHFVYHPKSFYEGRKISAGFSYLVILLVLGGAFYEWRKTRKDRVSE